MGTYTPEELVQTHSWQTIYPTGIYAKVRLYSLQWVRQHVGVSEKMQMFLLRFGFVSVISSFLGVHVIFPHISLQWRHNECDGVSNHRRLDYLLSRLFRCIFKKTSKLCVTGLCEEKPPVTDGFPLQRTSNAENIFSWRRSSCIKISLTGALTWNWNNCMIIPVPLN